MARSLLSPYFGEASNTTGKDATSRERGSPSGADGDPFSAGLHDVAHVWFA